MEDGLTESESGRKPSNSAKSTYKCALALAMIHLMLNRLEPTEADAKFCYRKPA
jgi:hypothetical protein